jgi:6-phosphogluconate dehydrogenase
VIASALFARFASQKKDAFGLRLVAALRNQFGGHAFTTADGKQGGETFTPK